MKEYKVFIASSKELKPERQELEKTLNEMNDSFIRSGISIKPILWERLLLDMGSERKQNYFNRKLKECDIVIFLFWDRLGQYTEEEFFAACDASRTTNNPKYTFIFFKDLDVENVTDKKKQKDIMKIKEFKSHIEKIEGLYNSYSQIQELIEIVKYQLRLAIKEDFPLLAEERGQNDFKDITFGKKLLTSPPRRSHYFVGREDEITLISKMLENENKVLLNGTGGMGKTEVAKKCFEKNYNLYDHLGWIEYKGDFRETLLDSIDEKILGLHFTDDDDIEKRFKEISLKLCNSGSKILLVIDNFDLNKNKVFDDYLEKLYGKNLYLLITSRNRFEGFFNEHRLEQLNQADCIKLFNNFSQTTANDEVLIEKIISQVDYNTLGIEMLAKISRKARLSLKKLDQILEENGLNIDSKLVETIDVNHNQRKFFEHLKLLFNVSNLSVDEQAILLNLSLLPSFPIQDKKIKTWLRLSSYNEINTLIECGWLKETEVEGERFIQLLSIIQEVTRDTVLFSYNKVNNLVEEITKLFVFRNQENALTKLKDLPLGVSTIKYCKEENEQTAILCNYISIIYRSIGDYDKALKYALKYSETAEHCFEQNHIKTAIAYNNLSLVYKCLGELDKALEVSKKTLKIAENNFEFDYDAPFTPIQFLAISYDNLSKISLDNGDYRNAMDYAEKALIIRKEFPDQNTENLAVSYNTFSAIYQEYNDFPKALEYALINLDLLMENPNPDKVQIATALSNIGNIYYNLDNNTLAFEYSMDGLQLKFEIYGNEHPDIITSLINLSNIAKDFGDYKKAFEYALFAEEMAQNVFKPSHPEKANVYFTISKLYRDTGNEKEALYYALKDIEIIENIYSADHLSLALSYKNISLIFLGLGEHRNALRYAFKALEITEKNPVSTNSDLANSYFNIGVIYHNAKLYPEALKYALTAIEITENKITERNYELGVTYNLASQICKDLLEPFAALEFSFKALKVIRIANKPSTDDISSVYFRMSRIYHDLGEYYLSLEYSHKAKDILNTKYERDHPVLLSIENHINRLNLLIT